MWKCDKFRVRRVNKANGLRKLLKCFISNIYIYNKKDSFQFIMDEEILNIFKCVFFFARMS